MKPSFLDALPEFRCVPQHRRSLRVLALCIGALLVLCRTGGVRRGIDIQRASASERRTQLETTLRSDRTPGARQRAAAALGSLGDTEALSVLIVALLGDEEAAVRAACADALAALADPAAQAALRAATHDEHALVRRQASAALSRLSPLASRPEPEKTAPSAPSSKGRVTVVVGRMGSKAKSGTMPDIPLRLREAVIKEARSAVELDVQEEPRAGSEPRSGFSIDSSVTRLTRRTTPEGELEVSCDVSMIIAVLPGRSVVGMVSGGASVIGPRGPSTRPTKAFIEGLETEALNQAVHESHASFMTFIRQKGSRP